MRSPDGVVCSAEVDKEIPGPVSHFEQVLHAVQVHGQQAGSTPDCGHAPRSNPNIWIKVSQRQDLSVEVVRPLRVEGKQRVSIF